MRTSTRYLIIGSGVSGYHALDELINADPKVDMIMVTNDSSLPYDRPPLSKEYMRGEVDRESIFFKLPETHRDRIRTGITVERIKANVAQLSNGDEIEFEKVLIATGGRPRKLNVPGGDRVKYLRTLDDADRIREKAKTSRSALIVGAGFIGMEVGASLTKLGIQVQMVEVKPYIWSTFVDERVSRFFQEYFEKRGVKFLLNESVNAFEERGRVKATLSSGGEIEADLVLVATGIQPNVELAERSGISVNNGILVDKHLRASLDNVYASGDVANIEDPVSGKRRRIEHWNNAEYTGRLAARNMMGKEEEYDFLSTVWSDIFDLHIESAGETTGYDEYVVRGKMEDLSFNVIYIKEGLVNGYVAVNRPGEELEALNSIIKERREVSPERLGNEDIELT
ncbi:MULTISPECIES: NAD(P)/FAD-dependent oxidoreductase [Metallosphaera]|uniref:FAD-dependent pyridine nucleotide-disulfide oxidoreductase n=3 Tax=Metallosphaera TaxID=41980 RepID=A4YE12_METS5|nr:MULTISPECIES: FAD/NAD(P)-binding oxidoreductase [Metallosphaera]ABP94664.1 FAD-dependent pyridine nucleotide-disulfide oxidoreductase [Metallosphaera sedula DSM 5348]AIM26651.1 FAD-dependent pyridine nucleotide-disulfide oxidoreductase [Metallosphaera sedula]AKV73621.1 pyridine nucleotide-disulfide oxidoreductase [Metallosphaera sedula]AKV75862.1 pyridine nucleotide-disulfide oxidoreductase [Metallosphaera sedula]AKV78111.1 pyridine nucleotide-disulfide oxidoreductase [Metallosphaera sedula